MKEWTPDGKKDENQDQELSEINANQPTSTTSWFSYSGVAVNSDTDTDNTEAPSQNV